MIETEAFYKQDTLHGLGLDRICETEPAPLLVGDHRNPRPLSVPLKHLRGLGQLARFGLAGGLNTLVDIVMLNGLLWLFPTTSMFTLLVFNGLAYGMGAVDSFLLNKYWTFAARQKVTRGELTRYTLVTLCGIGWSSAIFWLASTLLQPWLGSAIWWANASKVVAIGGTALISYIGMRLWVFVRKAPDNIHTRKDLYRYD